MTVRIYPPSGDSSEVTRIAASLLDAADNPSQVVVETGVGNGLSFLVPDEVAAKANLNLEPEPEGDAPAEGKKKSGKKGAAS